MRNIKITSCCFFVLFFPVLALTSESQEEILTCKNKGDVISCRKNTETKPASSANASTKESGEVRNSYDICEINPKHKRCKKNGSRKVDIIEESR